MPAAEPHCNCMYCQIARAFSDKESLVDQDTVNPEIEEAVSDVELTFREDWIINPESSNKNLYLVINPSDEAEKYTVFLGKPIGCTCGEKNCEHIRAVLNS